VVSHRVLADLEDGGDADPLRGVHDGLGVFEGDDVEGGGRVAAAGSPPDEVGGG
jgi:hypothetical protein